MRLATWNIEWFNALFTADDRPLDDDGPAGRYGTTRREQLAAIGIVLTALDADAILVVEAPDDSSTRSTVAALENFAALIGLRANRAVIGFASGTEQELALLYDPAALTASHDPQADPASPRFDRARDMPLGQTGEVEAMQFSRPPLELAVTPTQGAPFRLIGVHAKSQAIHGPHDDGQLWRLRLANRRKQLAECLWLRERVAGHLAAGQPLIVLGDLNDGPGSTDFAGLFGVSGVEIVMGCRIATGCDVPPELRLYDPHAMAALQRPKRGGPPTGRFWDPVGERYFGALLDYILVSPGIRAGGPRWRIWHPFDDPACWQTPELHQALLAASDHFPVTLDFTP